VRALGDGEVWTAFTYMFVHGSPMHLIGNLLLIGFVGRRLQGLIGSKQFTLLYFLAGLVGAGLQMVVETAAHLESVPIIGASACGCGLFLAYAAIMPEERISLLIYFIIPVTARFWTLAMVMIGVDAALGVSSLLWAPAQAWWGGHAYFAHIGGSILGWHFVRMLGYTGFSIDSQHLIRQRQAARRPSRRQQVARVRRERAMPEMDHEALERRRRSEPGRVREAPVMDGVNEILDKISLEGMGSLNDDERRALEAASRELARRQQSEGK
jgi:membrane associated rhomboid family serine protease